MSVIDGGGYEESVAHALRIPLERAKHVHEMIAEPCTKVADGEGYTLIDFGVELYEMGDLTLVEKLYGAYHGTLALEYAHEEMSEMNPEQKAFVDAINEIKMVLERGGNVDDR